MWPQSWYNFVASKCCKWLTRITASGYPNFLTAVEDISETRWLFFAKRGNEAICLLRGGRWVQIMQCMCCWYELTHSASNKSADLHNTLLPSLDHYLHPPPAKIWFLVNFWLLAWSFCTMHTTLLPSLDHLQPAVRWRIKNDFLTILGGLCCGGIFRLFCVAGIFGLMSKLGICRY